MVAAMAVAGNFPAVVVCTIYVTGEDNCTLLGRLLIQIP